MGPCVWLGVNTISHAYLVPSAPYPLNDESGGKRGEILLPASTWFQLNALSPSLTGGGATSYFT